MSSDLWIVTPVYNEERNLAAFVEEWMAVFRRVVGGNFTFCLLNDGSTDASLKILSSLAAKYPEIKVIDKPNSGHGRTCVVGYQLAVEAGARWIFNIDADGQCDSAYFEAFWKSRGDGRVHYGRRRAREDGWARRVISRVLSLVIFLLSGEWVRDANVPYRLMSLDALAGALPFIPERFRQANAALTFLHHDRPGITWHDIPFRNRTGRQLPLDIGYFVKESWRFIKDFLCLQWYFKAASLSQKIVLAGRMVLIIFAVYYLVAFLVVGFAMIFAPFAYDWLEGLHLVQIRRVLAGLPLYTPPSLDYVPMLYGPLYIYVASIFVYLFGEHYATARFISFFASLGSAVMLSCLIWKKTRSAFASLLAPGFFCGMFGMVQYHLVTGRVDALYVFLTLLFVFAIWTAVEKGGKYMAIAALAATGAVLTKQPALLVVGALCLWGFWINTFRARMTAFLCLIVVTASQLVPSLAGHPWFFYYLYQMPSGHPLLWVNIQDFLNRDILQIFSLGLAASLGAFYGHFRNQVGRRDTFLFLLAFLAMFIAGVLPRIKVGGGTNNLIPLAAAVALGCGLLAGLRFPAKGWPGVAAVLLLIGFNLQILYAPIPGERLAISHQKELDAIRMLGKLESPVFTLFHPYMASLAGKNESAFYGSFMDVLAAGGEPAQHLREELRMALEERRFRAIILPDPSVFKMDFPYDRLEATYHRQDPPDPLAYRNQLIVYIPKK